MTFVKTNRALRNDMPPTLLLVFQRMATKTAMIQIQRPTLIDVQPGKRHPTVPTLLTPLPITVHPLARPCGLLGIAAAARAALRDGGGRSYRKASRCHEAKQRPMGVTWANMATISRINLNFMENSAFCKHTYSRQLSGISCKSGNIP